MGSITQVLFRRKGGILLQALIFMGLLGCLAGYKIWVIYGWVGQPEIINSLHKNISVISPFWVGNPDEDFNHPHLFLLPLISSIFGFSVENVWMVNFIVSLPILCWLWWTLQRYSQLSRLIITFVVLSFFVSPLQSHHFLFPNSDVLTTLLLCMAFVLRATSRSYLAPMIVLALSLVAHERALVLFPAFVFWSAYCQKFIWMDSKNLQNLALEDAKKLTLIFVAFLLYKNLLYYNFPIEMPHKQLSYLQQARHLLRVENPHHTMNGALFEYVFSPDTLHSWGKTGFLYFNALWACVLCAIQRQYLLSWVFALMHLGTMVQLLVAEDAHRLTGFLLVPLFAQVLVAKNFQNWAKKITVGLLLWTSVSTLLYSVAVKIF